MKLLIVFLLALTPQLLLAKQPLVGRKAAQKYFSRAPADDSETVPQRQAPAAGYQDHYLALHFGGFVESESYRSVSSGDARNVGRENIGMTYRFDEYARSVDLLLRAELTWFEYHEGRPTKLSLVPLLIFPEASARFPLYFGFGAGPGVYLRQISGESSMALDYQLIVGVRFFDVFGSSAGLTIETGIKNHLHLLGSGQFNGVFLALGSVFIF